MDWDGAGAEYRQALLLSPGNADILHAYAVYLISLGRTDEAIACVTRARELDPASMEVSSDYAWFFYLARRYDEAIRQAHATLALLKMTQDSIPAIAKFSQSWSYYVLVHGSLKKGDAETVLSTVKARMRELGKGEAADRVKSLPQLLEWRRQFIEDDARKNPGHTYAVAMADAAVGRADGTLAALEQTVPQRRRGSDVQLRRHGADVRFRPPGSPLREDRRLHRPPPPLRRAGGFRWRPAGEEDRRWLSENRQQRRGGR